MPQKRKQSKKSSKPKSKSTSDSELTKVTQMLSRLSKPKNEVTDLGRMLLKGGNLASSFFGFPKIFGSGEYSMQNTLWNASQQVPIMHSSNEAVRIRHREYISDVSMIGSSFTLQTFSINPGLSTSFPYLSAVANNFQEYSFKGLVFEFKSTSATALVSGTNTAMGTVMMAAQYRSDAPPFTTKTQLLNEMWSVDTVPSHNVVLPIECAPQETPLTNQYVRGGTVTGDIKFFDLCTLSVATIGGQSGQSNIVGELWASYDVELRKPQLASIGGASGSTVFYSVGVSWVNNTLFANCLNSAANTLACVLSGNTITFPQGAGGYYYVIVTCSSGGSAIAWGAAGITAFSNCHQASNNVYTAGGLSSTGGYCCYGTPILVTAPANLQAAVTYNTGFTSGTGLITVQVISLSNSPLIWGT